jgi:hypothetical protein
MIRTLTLLCITLLLAVPAAAQTTLERAHLERELARSHQVSVQLDGTADPVVGRLRIVDDDAIGIEVGSQIRHVRFADITRIYREGDSLGNGALIGMGVLGGWCAYICGQGLNSGGHAVLAVLVNGAIGAGIGALIDASHTGTTTLYRRRPTVRVGPAASPRGVGISAAVTW